MLFRYRVQRVNLTVTVERVIARTALAHLRRAIIYRREGGIDRSVRASYRVGGILELRGYRARRGYARTDD